MPRSDTTTRSLVLTNAVALLIVAFALVGLGAFWMTFAGIMFGWVAATAVARSS